MSAKVIPELWLSVPLEEVILRIVGGGTPSKSKPEYYQGNIPWMSVKDMNKYVLLDTIDHISLEAVENSSTNVIPAGTPIIATRMSLGKIVVANFDSAINQDLKALFLPTGVHRDYLVYWYRSVARSIEQMGTGTTVKGIRLEVLKRLEFALPPLAEQKVIADKLDTLLAQVENTKTRLERIPQILKRFRQSVLAAAVSGRLTEEWRVSNRAAEPWKKVVFSELLYQLRSGAGEKPSNDSRGVPILRSSAVRPMEIDFQDVKYLAESSTLKDSNYLKENDLLFTRLSGSAEYVGNCAMVKNIECDYQYPDRLFCARLINPEQGHFLEYFFAAQDFREHISRSLKSSAGHQRITLDVIKKATITLPTLDEQTEIVRRVDQLFAHADRIEQQVNQALARVNNLTQSILAKAFRGELTEQWRKDNPELISGENSAEALLEKIKAERTAKAPAKRTRKKTTA